MKKIYLPFGLLIFVAFLVISCTVNNENDKLVLSLPTLNTKNPAVTGQRTATCGTEITSTGGSAIATTGLVYSLTQFPTTSDNLIYFQQPQIANYTMPITGLTHSTQYFVRAFATNNAGTAYGNQKTFTTAVPVAPSMSIISSTVNAIVFTQPPSATVNLNVVNDGGADVIERGLVWSTSVNPTVADFKTTNGSGTGIFVTQMTSLMPLTTYNIRGYLIRNGVAGVFYSAPSTVVIP
jgi:hypothetical protein